MYYYLKGEVTFILKDRIVVECASIGYEVLVAHPKEFPLGEIITIYTSLYYREDDKFLVGFKNLRDKEVFLSLLNVRGVGPKTAMNALSGAKTEELVAAIDSNNLLFLKTLPGIGPKAAAQIILDLRGKLTYSKCSETGNKELDEALSALKNLGFKQAEILPILKDIATPNLTVEDYIRAALRKLSKVN